MRVCVSLSLSLRARFDEREGERRLSSFSFFSSLRGRAIARVVFESERERERDGKFSRSVALLVEKEFGDLVLRAPDKDTERERATVSMKESIIRNDERKTIVVERASSFGRDDAFFVFLFLL